ncbi:MAG: hypothetical protein ACTSR8_06305 [Promethearchaeota archaeon]
MASKKPQCFTCKHNIADTSCGSCTSKGTEMVENIAKELGINISENQNELSTIKYNCKVIMRYPEEFESVDPFNCKFYLPSYFRF